MSAIFPPCKEQLVYLINNYDLVLGILMEHTFDNSKEVEAFRGQLTARSIEYVEEVTFRGCYIRNNWTNYTLSTYIQPSGNKPIIRKRSSQKLQIYNHTQILVMTENAKLGSYGGSWTPTVDITKYWDFMRCEGVLRDTQEDEENCLSNAPYRVNFYVPITYEEQNRVYRSLRALEEILVTPIPSEAFSSMFKQESFQAFYGLRWTHETIS
uniref:Vps52 C-terminal domain-containing protein n=1 Tax=Glossina palpalis gambiensis TaxID=67801 RepID=A0A1B0BPN5_9MUSC